MTIIRGAPPAKGPRYAPLDAAPDRTAMAAPATRPRFADRRREQLRKCKRVSATAATLAIAFAVCTWLTMSVYPTRRVVHVLRLKAGEPAVAVSEPRRFLSVGLDASVIAEGFRHFDTSNQRLRKMTANLGPAYLRVGGTMADRLRFAPEDDRAPPAKLRYAPLQDGGVCSHEHFSCGPVPPNFTMSAREWSRLHDMARAAGLTVVFDLNALTRYDNGAWNSSDAERLIEYSYRKGMTDVGWELGNEPNSFKHVFNYSVDAAQLAEDYRTLKEILQRSGYNNSIIIGPSVTRPRPENVESMEYLKRFLDHGGGEHVTAITFHHYYFNGRTATADQFIDPDVFNLLIAQTDLIEGIVNESNEQRKRVWLGETAAAYGGGAPGYNNRFLGTFIWLDKLGVSAKMGVEVVVRQSLFKGFYALIEYIGMEYQPTPDYWISVLYKQLVGPEVLPCYSTAPPEVRMYCHCVNRNFNALSAVTVYGLNMKNTDAAIRLQGFGNPYYSTNTIYAFILTSHGSLLSKDVDLNGRKLELTSGGELPMLKPHVFRHEEQIILPPYSIGFFVIMMQEQPEGCKKSIS